MAWEGKLTRDRSGSTGTLLPTGFALLRRSRRTAKSLSAILIWVSLSLARSRESDGASGGALMGSFVALKDSEEEGADLLQDKLA